MSGSAMRKAMSDFCRAKRRPARRRVAGSRAAASVATPSVTAPAMGGLRARVTLELGGGPGDRLVDGLDALRAARDHLGVDRLYVHLLRDVGRRGVAGHPGSLGRARRIVVHRAPGRADLFPHLEVTHALEGGDVVAAARVDDLLHVRALVQVSEQALRRALVLRELPRAEDERQEGCEAAFRSFRHLEGPALLGDLDVVAL